MHGRPGGDGTTIVVAGMDGKFLVRKLAASDWSDLYTGVGMPPFDRLRMAAVCQSGLDPESLGNR